VARKVTTMAAPEPLYYLAIDGTNAQDAAVFGALLEGRGWKNLATTFLKPAPDDPSRLVDPAHDFLPIPLVPSNGKRIAVVSPNGKDGKGLDRFWMTYSGEALTNFGKALGRYAAVELSGEYAWRLMLTPAIHSHELQPGPPTRHLADFRHPAGAQRAPSARILYVSSHGWLSGRMAGEVLEDAPAAQPPLVRGWYAPKARYFSLGKVAAREVGFHGPEWIVLAQCSTLNSACWPLWSRILGRSTPGVRGILAYEEVSPGALPAARIAEAFFQELDKGAPFLDAWIRANRGQHWAALVHKSARNDTLKDFPRFGELLDVDTSETRATYRGYLPSLGPIGVPVLDEPPPFTLKIEHHTGAMFEQVVPERLGDPVSRLIERHRYQLTIAAPEGWTLRKATLTLVHIRLSHPQQFGWDTLFTIESLDAGVKMTGSGTTTLTLAVDKETPSIVLRLRARDLQHTALEEDHSYLWIRGDIETDNGNLQYDFKTYGLEW
jgi:hypothetical protein